MFHRSLPPLPSLFLLIALTIFSFPAAQAATFTVSNLLRLLDEVSSLLDLDTGT